MLLALPYLLFLLPEGFFAKISELLSISPAINETLAAWKDGLLIFKESVFFGIGSGAALPANTLLAIALDFGAVALGIIFVILILRLVQFSAYGIYMRSSLLPGWYRLLLYCNFQR